MAAFAACRNGVSRRATGGRARAWVVLPRAAVDRINANSFPAVSGQSASPFSIVEPVSVPLKVTLEDWGPGPEGMSADVQVLDPATGAGQQGVTGSHGVNSIGLLVRAWGRVTEVDPSPATVWFRIDDGSGRPVKCVVVGVSPTVNPLWAGRFVEAAGISSCEVQGGSVVPTILLRANAAPIVH